jgi:methyltransferase
VVSGPGLALIGAVAAERVVELVLARRNAAWAVARGGREHGRGHYPFVVALHAAWLAGCLAEPALTASRFDAARFAAAASALVAAQALRWWTIATLGRRWNTRVIVLPGLPLVTGGPFRLLRHPNYLAVAVELAALPVAVGAWATAAGCSALNGLLMAIRIPCEEAALGLRGGRP